MTAQVRPGWQRWTVIGVVVAIVVAAGGLWWWQTHRKGATFSAVFSESVGIYPGSDVRILGVRVGSVDSVEPRGTDVVVGMHLDPDARAAPDTWAVIISPTLVGDRYVQLTGVYSSGPALASGTRIPLQRTRTPVELNEMYRNLIALTKAFGPSGANRDGALNRLLVTAAANLRGNGDDVNATLKQLAKASQAFADSKDHIAATLGQLASFTSMLQTNDRGVVTVNEQLAEVTTTLADDRDTFAAAMKELGSALALVQKFVHDNRAALSADVGRLNTVAGVLAQEKASLTKAISAAPLLTQNFINAYDPKRNLIRGRTNLNEIGVWNSGAGTTSNGPPVMLPSAGDGS